jgi:hypothetical protein
MPACLMKIMPEIQKDQKSQKARILPAVIISSTSFFIAIWTLSISDIMIIAKTVWADNFERTKRKEGRHQRRSRDSGAPEAS